MNKRDNYGWHDFANERHQQSNQVTMKMPWASNTSMADEPSSTQDVIQRVDHILDTKYEMTDIQLMLAQIILTKVSKIKIRFLS